MSNQQASKTHAAPGAPGGLAVEAETAPVAPLGVLRGFHPGWFAVVMGTAIVGVATYLNPGEVGAMVGPAHAVGVTVVVLAWVLAVVIAVPYLLRLVRHREAALADLRHPIVGGLYATAPAAVLVLAVATAAVGGSVLSEHTVVVIVVVLAATGSMLAFAAGVLFAYVLFSGDGLAAETANGGWFIPPVVAIIIPLALAPLLAHVGPAAGRLLLLTSYGALGIGLFLFAMIAAVLFGRLIFHPLPPAPLAPSLWIGLGPVGVGSLALLRLAEAGGPYWGAQAHAVQTGSQLAAASLWGVGLWWLATAALLLIGYLRRDRLPYGIGLWAFTFPLGAYTVATLQLARTWQTDPLEWVGVALYLLLLSFWLVVATRTVRAIRTGEAWVR
jgi:C4-dicarboxylate transporter/malic acid transport protein